MKGLQGSFVSSGVLQTPSGRRLRHPDQFCTRTAKCPLATCRNICNTYPDSLAALAIKYGGSSPRAVPAPQHTASSLTFDIIAHIVTDSGFLSDGQMMLKRLLHQKWAQSKHFRSGSFSATSEVGSTCIVLGKICRSTYSSGYGGSGKFKDSHSYAARVT